MFPAYRLPLRLLQAPAFYAGVHDVFSAWRKPLSSIVRQECGQIIFDSHNCSVLHVCLSSRSYLPLASETGSTRKGIDSFLVGIWLVWLRFSMSVAAVISLRSTAKRPKRPRMPFFPTESTRYTIIFYRLRCVFHRCKRDTLRQRLASFLGYPEEIARYFCLEEEYEGYLWTAHGRFPTNTPGWWGGAHPFSILDWTVVHNGEISSYGINHRYLEQFGYHCTMQTDTEVVAYAIDLLMRKHGLPIEIVAHIFAPPFWDQIERCTAGKRELLRTLRQVYGSLLLNGPFTVIIAHQGEMIGLTDRIRLRPLTVGVKGDMLYLSSEEASIRLVCRDLDRAWIPMGGEPIVGRLKVAKVPEKEAVLELV